jgi:hypothetical protein
LLPPAHLHADHHDVERALVHQHFAAHLSHPATDGLGFADHDSVRVWLSPTFVVSPRIVFDAPPAVVVAAVALAVPAVERFSESVNPAEAIHAPPDRVPLGLRAPPA